MRNVFSTISFTSSPGQRQLPSNIAKKGEQSRRGTGSKDRRARERAWYRILFGERIINSFRVICGRKVSQRPGMWDGDKGKYLPRFCNEESCYGESKYLLFLWFFPFQSQLVSLFAASAVPERRFWLAFLSSKLEQAVESFKPHFVRQNTSQRHQMAGSKHFLLPRQVSQI